ncbi:MAG: dipeptidyl aminopeptidase/acylaminoacyl peptidase, partial [Paraglaciecola sp.]
MNILSYLSRTTLIIIMTLVCYSSALHGASSPASAPTLADYGQLPTIQNMAVSPSGERLAYRKTSADNDLIIIYSVAENKVITGLNAAEIEPKDIYFVSENELILIVSSFGRIDGYRGEHTTSSAYVFNIKTKRLTALMKAGGLITPGYLNLSNIVGLSPDKKRLYMAAHSGEKLSMNDNVRPKYSLMNVRLNKPSRPSFHSQGSIDTIDYFVGKDGKPLVEERYNNLKDQHSILVYDGENWKEIYTKTEKIRTINLVGLAADFKSLVVLKYNNDTGRIAYYLMSLADASLSLSGMSRSDADIEDVITDINRVVYGVSYSGFNRSYKFFDQSLDQRMKDILAKFPDHTVWLKSWSPDWKNLLVYAEGPSSPGDFYLFPLDQAPSFIATARPNIAPEHIHPIADLTIKARDGLKIPTVLTIPQRSIDSLKNLPAVILPHGGPESYDQIRFDWLAQAIASHGFLVIQPQFRGSTGFGSEHRRAGYGEWGKKMQDDLSDSVAYLSDKGIIDGDKVCIVGASYGGYAALAGGAFTPDLYKCVVSVNGVSDLNKMLSSADYYTSTGHWVLSYWEKLLANGETDKKALAGVSPLNFADNFTAPTLLIHGENDHVVRMYQSERMYSKLKSSK